jgi:hypothetical protein
MTTTCSSGHASADPEWCDTCGERIGQAPTPGAAAPHEPPGSPARSAAPPVDLQPKPERPCAHCGVPNHADALFCEACGYDFTTGQVPAPAPDAPAPTPTAHPVVDGPTGWIVIVEVDQAWFALKGALADTPCPPPSSSTVSIARSPALIGRSSASRGLRPEVALDSDTGVSRRHAQLTVDEGSIAVTDLSSTNGTFVVAAGEQPDDDTAPLAPGVSRPLADGDAVYVGAWTRLVVRRA